MPNPGGTAYTPFPAHPLDKHAALSLHPSRSLIPFPRPSYSATPRPPLSFVSHSPSRCTKLQFIAVSLAPIRPSLLPPLSYVSHPVFLTPTVEAIETPTSYATLEYPPCISLPLSGSTLSAVFLVPLPSSLSLSFALTCHAVGRSARRSAATGVANSLLATSAPLGRFRAPAGGIRQCAPRCLAGKLYVVNRFSFLTDTCESSFLTKSRSRATALAFADPSLFLRRSKETRDD